MKKNKKMKVLITGASKGIGRAIATKFAQNGAELCLCSRNMNDLNQLKEDLQSTYSMPHIHLYSADLSIKQEVLSLSTFVKDIFVAPDVLINNAGLFKGNSIVQEQEEDMEYLMNLNFLSVYYLTKDLLPGMIARKSGHIFNMCSIASILAYPNGGAYGASKHALHGFSKVLREETKSLGIKVTSILPGATWSDSWKGAGIEESRFIEAKDIANIIWNAYQTGKNCVIEDIIIRPQLGDI